MFHSFTHSFFLHSFPLSLVLSEPSTVPEAGDTKTRRPDTAPALLKLSMEGIPSSEECVIGVTAGEVQGGLSQSGVEKQTVI